MIIGDSRPYMILVRGDRELDESKMNRRFTQWRMMTDEEILSMGFIPGFVGPREGINGITILKISHWSHWTGVLSEPMNVIITLLAWKYQSCPSMKLLI